MIDALNIQSNTTLYYRHAANDKYYKNRRGRF